MKPEKPHKHELVPEELESRVYRVEEYQGQKSESLTAIDKIKVWKCKCGYSVAQDMERKVT